MNHLIPLTEEESEIFAKICKNYNNVLISPKFYAMLAAHKIFAKLIHPVTDGSLMICGLYANILLCKIWLSRYTFNGEICVSNNKITSSSDFDGWSPDFELKDFDKFDKLKGFW